MKYRIVEFPNEKERFFVETGQVVEEKIWWIFYRKNIVWEKDTNADGAPISHLTYDKAIKRVKEIKRMQPVIHQIK